MSTEIRYFENRKDWRKWLADNFDTADGVWFVFPTKSSSEKSIVYNDAVEEALCFGWIDSTIKSLDKEHKIQRFTPRNPKSTYSQANKERLKWLLEHKMIHLEFEDKIRTVLSVPFVFPNDIIDRLKEDERIWNAPGNWWREGPTLSNRCDRSNFAVCDWHSYWYASWFTKCQRNFGGSYRANFT